MTCDGGGGTFNGLVLPLLPLPPKIILLGTTPLIDAMAQGRPTWLCLIGDGGEVSISLWPRDVHSCPTYTKASLSYSFFFYVEPGTLLQKKRKKNVALKNAFQSCKSSK